MDFVTRYSFPFYILYCICSFLGFFFYSLEKNNSLFVAFVFACIAGVIFIVFSALFILPLLFLITRLFFSFIRFIFQVVRF